SSWTSHTFVTPCEASSVPYIENFDAVTAPDFPLCMTVENTNLDVKEWITNSTTYLSAPNSAMIGYNTDGTTAMNDWFFTNGLNLTSGTAYEISFVYLAASATYPEKLAVDWGNAPISTAMSGTPIFNNSNITGGWFIGTATVTPATSGTYYFGFHGYSVADMFNLYVDDIKVVEVVASTAWSGALDNDWDKSGNWTNGIPSSTTNVTLPAGLTNYPTLTSAESCNNLLISSSASGTASILDNSRLIVNGTATIQRYLTGNNNTDNTFDFHQVSIPLNSDGTAGQFMGMYLYQFDPILQDYVSIGNDPATVLNNNQGFMVFYPNTNTTINFTGQINSGTFTAVTATDAVDEFSLVPNPYPSAINWDALSGWTKTNLQNAFYIWDPVSNNYVAWSGGAGTALTGNIPVGQSFFVKANAASPVLTMTNAVRVHSTQAFWKESESIVQEVFHLNVKDNESADEMIVRFSKDASNERGFLDVDKLYGADIAPQLYSVTSSDDKLTINALPHSTQTIVVPVGIEYPGSSELSFTASGLESFESSVSIFLEDKLLNKTIDLRLNPVYNFTHTAGADPMRFNLVFYGVNSTGELSTANYNIWVNNDKINVLIPEMIGQKAVVQLIDQQGRILDATSVTLDSPSVINAPVSSGLYIVRVIVGNQVFTSKVFIR
ncbi:MAG: T9SS type A sorting domain-containing protein, partial [Bacteroidales bacterium]